MYHQSRNRLHAPAPLLKQMITAGLLGRKTGRGFYTYDGPDSPVVVPDAHTPVRSGRVRRADARGPAGRCHRHRHDGDRHRRGVRQARLRRRAARARPGQGRGGARQGAQVAGAARSSRASCPRPTATPRSAGSRPAVEFVELADCDLVVEAVAEELAIKKAVFAALDEVCKPGAILATTTSSLPVIECAAATSRPGDVVGLHFFNPAQVMKLVEIVETISTARRRGRHRAQGLPRPRQAPGALRRPSPGFIVNALLFPYLNDAVKMLEAHYAEADDIDNAMKVGCGLPMGPFELLDVVGLDVSLAIERTLYLSSASPGSRRRRCWSTWSPPVGSAARPARVSATTRDAGLPRSSCRRLARWCHAGLVTLACGDLAPGGCCLVCRPCAPTRCRALRCGGRRARHRRRRSPPSGRCRPPRRAPDAVTGAAEAGRRRVRAAEVERPALQGHRRDGSADQTDYDTTFDQSCKWQTKVDGARGRRRHCGSARAGRSSSSRPPARTT